jgi:hypothetical protein
MIYPPKIIAPQCFSMIISFVTYYPPQFFLKMSSIDRPWVPNILLTSAANFHRIRQRIRIHKRTPKEFSGSSVAVSQMDFQEVGGIRGFPRSLQLPVCNRTPRQAGKSGAAVCGEYGGESEKRI